MDKIHPFGFIYRQAHLADSNIPLGIPNDDDVVSVNDQLDTIVIYPNVSQNTFHVEIKEIIR